MLEWLHIARKVPHREQHDAGRLHRILGRQCNATVVDAGGELAIVGAAHRKVPLEEIVLHKQANVHRGDEQRVPTSSGCA